MGRDRCDGYQIKSSIIMLLPENLKSLSLDFFGSIIGLSLNYFLFYDMKSMILNLFRFFRASDFSRGW